MRVPLRLRMSVPEPPMTVRNLREVRPAVDLDETLPLGTMRRRPAHDVLPMRCLSCHGRVERSAAPVNLVHDGCQVSWDAIPAWVCTQCRRPYFEPREVELVRRSLRAMRALPKPV
jgi:uncharacterized protein with PIN domain